MSRPTGRAVPAWAGLATLAGGPAVAWAQQGSYYDGHMGGAWHGWFFGPLMMVLLLAAVVALVVLVLRWLGPHGPSQGASPTAAGGRTAIDILKERFARGEIDREEFEERRRVLEQ